MFVRPTVGAWPFDSTWRAHSLPFDKVDVDSEMVEKIEAIKDFARANGVKGRLQSLSYCSLDRLEDLAKGAESCEC